ncbi:hypothetical protein RFUL19S_02677 [Rhizobacter fulvus]|jgi:hypothetical protein
MRRSALRTATGRTRCDPLAPFESAIVIRWLIVVFIALILFSGLRPWLEKLGLGRLPGDFRFRLFGREWFVPFASSVVLSLLAMALMKLL